MSGYRAPLRAPRRDPRHYRFALPNRVWGFGLRPAEFVTLAWLYYHHAHGQGAALTAAMVADHLHISVATARKYLLQLRSAGHTDGVLFPTLRCKNGEPYFTLPNEVFILNLPQTALMVYAYLLFCEDRRSHRCWPSYRTMAEVTGLSVSTVMKAVGVLAEKQLVSVEHTSRIDCHGMKRNSNNRYTILPIGLATGAFYQRQLTLQGVLGEKSAG